MLVSLKLTHHQDGRSAFDPEEEEAILILLRKKTSWPCFPPDLAHLGKRFRSNGYHEKRRGLVGPPTSSTTPSPESTPIADKFVAAAAGAINGTSEGVSEILQQLSDVDASYLTRLGSNVVCNFNTEFTMDVQQTISEIMRLVILARTNRCCTVASSTAAEDMCVKHSTSPNIVVTVCDLAAGSFVNRYLAQNAASIELFGNMVGGTESIQVERDDLFRLMLAIGGAFHQPGIAFEVAKQQVICPRSGATILYDMTYLVDPDSFYLATFGQRSS